MPTDGLGSTLKVISIASVIISVMMYLFAVIGVIKRFKSRKRKSSGIGVLCVILGTLFAVIAFQLYVGFSLWFIIGLIVGDSILVFLLTDQEVL